MDNQWQPISVNKNKHIGERRVYTGGNPTLHLPVICLGWGLSSYGILGDVGLAIVFLHCVHVTAKWFFGEKMRKAFVCGNWPQVQETSNPYSLQVEQKALREKTYSLEQTGLKSCGNWSQNHFKACKTLSLINLHGACFRKSSDDVHYNMDYYLFVYYKWPFLHFLHSACKAQDGLQRIHEQHSWHDRPWVIVLFVFFPSAFKEVLITHQHQQISVSKTVDWSCISFRMNFLRRPILHPSQSRLGRKWLGDRQLFLLSGDAQCLLLLLPNNRTSEACATKPDVMLATVSLHSSVGLKWVTNRSGIIKKLLQKCRNVIHQKSNWGQSDRLFVVTWLIKDVQENQLYGLTVYSSSYLTAFLRQFSDWYWLNTATKWPLFHSSTRNSKSACLGVRERVGEWVVVRLVTSPHCSGDLTARETHPLHSTCYIQTLSSHLKLTNRRVTETSKRKGVMVSNALQGSLMLKKAGNMFINQKKDKKISPPSGLPSETDDMQN